MGKTSAPTLEDVALLAGVSTASISRALNEPGKVAESTRKKIENAIETLGYTPNFGGRVLASNRTNTVGAIIPSMANAMFANTLQTFQDELVKSGVTLLVATTGFDAEQELIQIKSLVSKGADGLLLIGSERPAATWDFIDKRHVPHVIAWSNLGSKDRPYVGFDNAKAAEEAARQTLLMGHRRLAMISGIKDGNDRARARHEGVQKAIDTFGQGARMTHFVEAVYKLDAGAEALAEIMRQPEKPTVVLCGNDALAAGAMMQARNMGLSLPRDLSFVGFDDIGIARVVTPPLATVRVPQVQIGQAAARLLLQRIAGEEKVASVSFEAEFVHRASLAPPLEA